MLHVIYSRETGSKEVSKTEKDNSTVKGVQTSTQMIIAGAIKANENGTPAIKEARSKSSGKLFITVHLEDVITEDPNFGPVSEETSIVFIDKTGGKFGDQLDATKAQKQISWVKDGKRQYINAGTPVIVKCTKNVTSYEDGTTEAAYFGTTIIRAGKRTLSFKTNDNGIGCTSILSRIVVKDDEVYAPLDNWDRELYQKLKDEGIEDAAEQAKYTTWVRLLGVDPNDEKFAKSVGEDGTDHASVCAVVCAPKAYTEQIDETSNRVVSAEMQVEAVYRIA